jgi:8-oxo-dGTP pyrophosphatase MutT (NUDIX family)
MAPQPPDALPSATILLVRDGARAGADQGLEVFMVQRHHQIDFASSALVFPGGKVDPGDRDPRLRARCGAAAAGLDDDALAIHVAAIRETFEECGVLLARPRGEEALVEAGRLASIQERYAEPLAAHDLPISEVAEDEDLELAIEALVPFAHWITPTFMPKRFDTWFFLVAAPPDQLAAHDGVESVDSLWTTVDRAMADADAGTRTIIFPTRMQLGKLGQSRTVDEALAAARAAPVVTVMPRMERDAGGARRMVLPEDAGYDLDWAPIDSVPRS